MELRQLEYFVAVAEEASFTRAAARVHISQSGVSAQLRQLERELGIDLIDRSSRTATLTAAGAAAIESARAALSAAAAVRDAVDDVRGLMRGDLALGMVTGCEVGPWFAALADFRHDHEAITVDLEEGDSATLVDRIISGELDAGLVAVAGAVPAELESAAIVSEGLAALVPTEHPLARRRTVPLAMLVDHPLVTLPPGTGVRGALEASATAAHVSPEIALQASAPSAVADLARRGAGAGVLSQSMAAGFAGDDLHAVRITGAPVPAILALAWRPEPSPAARAFVARATAAFDLD